MKRSHLLLAGALLFCNGAYADVTIDECLSKAEEHYPIVRKYGLLERTSEINLSDINKGWLPRISVYGQATMQNDVPGFPESLTGIMAQMGGELKGLSKFQYKVGVDVNQTIWDGGASKARREQARAQQEAGTASLDVERYAVRQRVQNLYFAILLTESQIQQSETALSLIQQNLEKMQAMLKNGTAMQSDVDMFEAKVLETEQTIALARNALNGYRKMLSLFTGEDMANERLTMPSAELPADESCNRPELRLFEKRLINADTSLKLSETSLMPKIGFFAQSYYGYPGFNYFNSMLNRDLSFNIIGGVKISWNVDSFYTKKNNRSRSLIEKESVEADKEIFEFNNNLEKASKIDAIKGYAEQMKDDNRIVELRGRVRASAESQLRNGVIDATTLMTKITDENIARLNSTFHKIQYLQEIYNLKYTLNR